MKFTAVLGVLLAVALAALALAAPASAATVERVVDGGFEATTGCQGTDINSCTNPFWTKTESVPTWPQARFCRTPPCQGGAATGAGFISLGHNARNNPGHVPEIGSISQQVDFTGVTTVTFKLWQLVVMGFPGPVETLVDGTVVDTRPINGPYGVGYTPVTVDVSGVSDGVHTLTLRVNCPYAAAGNCAWWNIDDVSALATVPDPPPPAPPAPDTAIADGPKSRTTDKHAHFEFSSDTTGAAFECSLDDDAFAPCSSPQTVKVDRGRHSFSVRAVAAGLTDATPATYDWMVKKKHHKKHHGGGKG